MREHDAYLDVPIPISSTARAWIRRDDDPSVGRLLTQKYRTSCIFSTACTQRWWIRCFFFSPAGPYAFRWSTRVFHCAVIRRSLCIPAEFYFTVAQTSMLHWQIVFPFSFFFFQNIGVHKALELKVLQHDLQHWCFLIAAAIIVWKCTLMHFLRFRN